MNEYTCVICATAVVTWKSFTALTIHVNAGCSEEPHSSILTTRVYRYQSPDCARWLGLSYHSCRFKRSLIFAYWSNLFHVWGAGFKNQNRTSPSQNDRKASASERVANGFTQFNTDCSTSCMTCCAVRRQYDKANANLATYELSSFCTFPWFKSILFWPFRVPV